MKPTIKWINTAKPRKTLSNISFKEDTVYPAHTLKTVSFSPYVNKKSYDTAINALKMVHKTSNNQHAEDYLKEIDELGKPMQDI